MTFEDLFLADLVIPKLCLIVIGKVFIYMCVAKKFVDEIRDRQYQIAKITSLSFLNLEKFCFKK